LTQMRNREGMEIPLFPLAFASRQLGSKVPLGSPNDRARRLREDLAKFSVARLIAEVQHPPLKRRQKIGQPKEGLGREPADW
jgi:hypothetical protein